VDILFGSGFLAMFTSHDPELEPSNCEMVVVDAGDVLLNVFQLPPVPYLSEKEILYLFKDANWRHFRPKNQLSPPFTQTRIETGCNRDNHVESVS
jgi:hypothetical protein